VSLFDSFGEDEVF